MMENKEQQPQTWRAAVFSKIAEYMPSLEIEDPLFECETIDFKGKPSEFASAENNTHEPR